MPPTEIRGYEAVRAAARDVATYSSDLQGDRDVRAYHQLPLEADPPRHTLFREALQPLFMGAAIEPHVPEFERWASELIKGIVERGGGDIASELALPYVIGCLGIIYSRPQDVDEWVSWGPDVWTAEAHINGTATDEARAALRERRYDAPTQRSGSVLHAYLHRVLDAAEAKPITAPKADIWDTVARMRIDGRAITREEMLGIGSVLLAGGRDTVIKLVTGIVWHLIRVPEDREFLASHPEAFNRTVAEMVRYLSPLPKIERVRRHDGKPSETPEYVLLSFVSANHDATIWQNADEIDIHRERKPHLAFGFGRHSCLGMNITEHEARALLTVLLDVWPTWRFDGEPEIAWVTEGQGADRITVIDRFDHLDVTL